MNLNSLVDQRISSSEKRERCIIRIEAGGHELQRKIAVRDRVEGVAADLGEVEELRYVLTVDGEGRSGQGACAERHDIRPPEAVLHPPLVALAHFHVCEHVMGKKDRLGGLQMGVPRHDNPEVLLRLEDQRVDQQVEVSADLDQFVPEVEPDVERNLIVARTTRMEAFPSFPDSSGKSCLDVHVDILERDREVELPLLDLTKDFLQPADYFLHIRQRNDLLPSEHTGMGNRAPYILVIEALVELDRSGELLYEFIGRLSEPTSPQFLVSVMYHDSSPCDGTALFAAPAYVLGTPLFRWTEFLPRGCPCPKGPSLVRLHHLATTAQQKAPAARQRKGAGCEAYREVR